MQRKSVDFELIGVGLAALVINAVVAYLLVFRLDIYSIDSMSRAGNARAVFFGSDPKLTNIGFVWPPLTVLLQLPFVLIPGMGYRGLAGNAVTVLAGTGAVIMLMLFLRQVNLPRPVRWLLLATFALNPMIVYYSANGMSEMIYVFFVLVALYFYWRWRQEGSWVWLSSAGVAMGLAILTRYEAIFVTAVLMLVVGLEGLLRRPDDPRVGESMVLIFASPAVYMSLLWVAANWVIMGNPLFFVSGQYSVSGKIGLLLAAYPELLPNKGNLAASLWTAFREAWNVFPAFAALSGVLLILMLLRGNARWLGMFVVAWSPILFGTLNIFSAQIMLIARYFVAAIPMAYLLSVGVLQLIGRGRTLAGLALAVLLGVSGYSTARVMLTTPGGAQDSAFVRAMLTGQPVTLWHAEEEMANYIDTQTVGQILVDDEIGHVVFFFSGQISRFVGRADPEFTYYLRNPRGHVAYILASKAGILAHTGLFNEVYPDLFEHGADWAQLEKESGDWRLYRVIDSPG